ARQRCRHVWGYNQTVPFRPAEHGRPNNSLDGQRLSCRCTVLLLAFRQPAGSLLIWSRRRAVRTAVPAFPVLVWSFLRGLMMGSVCFPWRSVVFGGTAGDGPCIYRSGSSPVGLLQECPCRLPAREARQRTCPIHL